MSKIPENFTAAVFRDGDGTWVDRHIYFSKSHRRPMYEVHLTRTDRKARKALEEMTGARWDRYSERWLVRPERVHDLIAWAEQFMGGGAWTDAETYPGWRGVIDAREGA